VTLTTTGTSVANAQTLLDGLAYENTSSEPTTSDRVATLTSIKDSGGIDDGGVDTTTLAVTSTVTVNSATQTPSLRLHYGQGADPVLQMRDWDYNTDSWSAETATISTGSAIKWVVNQLSTDRYEELAVILSDSGAGTELDMTRWDGNAWTVDWTATGITSAFSDARGFDIAYEASSGDAMVVYSDDTANPVFRTWNGTSWSTEQSVFASAPGSGTVLWVELDSRPNTDEIALVYSDSFNALHAVIWDGTSWTEATTETTLETSLKTIDYRGFDVAYENSGDLLVAWGRGTNVDFATMAAGTTTWDTTGTPFAPVSGNVALVDLAAEPGGDRIALMILDVDAGTERLGLSMWNGTSWQNTGEYDSVFDHVETDGFGESWASVGWVGTSGEAVVVYSDADAGAVNWGRWTSGSGWTIQGDISAPGAGLLRSVQIESYPDRNELMTVFSDENGELWAATYDGTTWSVTNAGTTLESNLSDDKTVAFSFDLNANTHPLTNVDAYNVNEGTTLNVAAPGLLANDTDADSDAITILDHTRPTNGSVTVNADGSFDYTPDIGFTGIDSFSYVATDGKDGTVHYWNLDGDGTDSVGSSNGVLMGAPTSVVGHYGNALSFDQVDDYIEVPDFTYSDDFTMSLRFKVDDITGNFYQYLYSHGALSTTNSLNVYIGETLTAQSGILRTRLLDSNDADNTALDVNISGLVDDGQWHTYTLTVESGVGAKVFIDGTLSSSSANGGDSFNPGTSMFLGVREDLDVDRFYGGSLDSVQIFNRNLTADQVVDVHTGGASLSDVTITVDPANDAPVVAGADGTLAYTEGDGAQVIDATLNITDLDDTNIESATVTISGGLVNTEDVLAFADTSNITGTYVAATGILTLTGTDTLANYEAALESITYTNTNLVDPDTGDRIVTWVVNDGDNNSAGVTSTITVAASNDVPVVADAAGTLAYTEGDGARVIDSSLTLTDVDDTNIESATISITAGFVNTEDMLAFSNLSNITGSYVAATGILTLTGTDTLANYEAALESITYTNTNLVNPDTGDRTVTWLVNDGDTNSAEVTSSITVASLNDAPVVGGAGETLAYTEGDGAVVIDATLAITDVNDTSIESATVTISGGFVDTEDVLTFVDVGPITGSYNAATGVLTLTGSDTLANYELALESVTYENTNTDNPNTGNRTVTWLVNDGDTNSAEVTSSITVAPANDAPTATNLTSTSIYNEGDATVPIADILVSDVDTNPAQTITATLTLSDINAGVLSTSGTATYTGATGIWTITDSVANVNAALAAVAFTPAANYDQDTSITTHIEDQDGAGPADGFITLDVTPANDAPTLLATSVNPSFTAGGLDVDLFSGVSIDTVEAGQTIEELKFEVTNVVDGSGANEFILIDDEYVALSDTTSGTTVANGYDFYVSLSGTTATVTLTTSGTPATNAEILIDDLAYFNDSENPATVNRVVTLTSIRDSGGTSNGGVDFSSLAVTSTVTFTSGNSDPIVANPIADQNATEGTLFDFTLPSDVFEDTESPILTLSATLADNSALPGWLGFDPVSGTFSGTPTDGDVGNYAVKVTAQDDDGGTVSDTFGIAVANIDNTPVISGANTGAVTEDDDPDADGLLEVSDTLTVVDLDIGESGFVADTIIGTFGVLSIDTGGTWNYTADNSQAALQQLDASESVTDTFTLTTLDGTNIGVAVTINGADDAAIIGGAVSGIVVEDTLMVANGTLTISDVDTSDNPVSFQDTASTLGDNGFGSFEMVNGEWTYTLNNGHLAVQNLVQGVSLTDTHDFVASDGSVQRVSVTIDGTEEVQPVDPFALVDAETDIVETDQEAEPATPAIPIETEPDAAPTQTGEAISEQSEPVGEEEEEGQEEADSAQQASVDLSDVLNVYKQSVVYPDRHQYAGGSVTVTAEAYRVDNEINLNETVLDRFINLTSLTIKQVELNSIKLTALKDVFRSDSFSSSLDQLGDNLDDAFSEQDTAEQLGVASVAGIAIGVSASIVAQVLRAGSLFASLLSVVPLWRQFDPLPVLSEVYGDEDQSGINTDKTEAISDEELEDIFDQPGEEDT
jgi:VCBS repeat-containing protein